MGYALLLRHGRSTANVDGVLGGRMPGVQLHTEGIEQAIQVATCLRDVALASIHVSPMERTQQTAAIVVSGQTWKTAPEIQECDYGEWTGRTLEALSTHPLWKILHSEPSAVRFPGGESIPEVAARAITYVTQHARADGMHLFVTHADPILMLANAAAGAPLDAYQRLLVDTCSLTIVQVDGDQLRLIATNLPASGVQTLLGQLAR